MKSYIMNMRRLIFVVNERVLGHLCAHIGQTGPVKFSEDDEVN